MKSGWYYLIFSVNALTLAVSTSFANTDIKTLTKEGWILIICLTIGIWTNTLLAAFFTNGKGKQQQQPNDPTPIQVGVGPKVPQ